MPDFDIYVPNEQAIQGALFKAQEMLMRGVTTGPAVIRLTRPKRSSEQNRLMWPLCRDFSAQAELNGQKLNAEEWKIVLSDAYEGNTKYLPKLDGQGMISVAPKTSVYPKDTFSDFLEFIFAAGAEKGVQFSDESKQCLEEAQR